MSAGFQLQWRVDTFALLHSSWDWTDYCGKLLHLPNVMFQKRGVRRVFCPGCRTVSNNGSGSSLAPAQNILVVQVWLGFT